MLQFLQIKKFDCVIVSVHLKATGLGNEDLSRLQEEIDKVPELINAIEQRYPGKLYVFFHMHVVYSKYMHVLVSF